MKKWLVLFLAMVLASCTSMAPAKDYLYLYVSTDDLAPKETNLEPGIYRILSDDSDLQMVTRPGSFFSSIKNGKIVYTEYGPVTGHTDLWIADADGSNARAVMVTPTASEDQAKWSPTGRKIGYFGPTSSFCTVDPDGQNNWCLDRKEIDDRWVMQFDFGTDDQTVILVTTDLNGLSYGHLFLLKLKPEGGVDSVTDLGDGREPAFSPNGRLLAYNNHNELYITYLATGGVYKLEDIGVNEFAWSPDGHQIAVSDFESKLWITNELLGAPWLLDSQPDFELRDLHWSPDGKQLAYMASHYTYDRYQVELTVAELRPDKSANIKHLKSFDYPDVGYGAWLVDWVNTQ